jgi:hypothetical protein
MGSPPLQEIQALSDVGDGPLTFFQLGLDHGVLLEHIPSPATLPREQT